jgi:hypothetical protein
LLGIIELIILLLLSIQGSCFIMLTPEARLLIDVRLAQRVLAMMFMVAQSRFFTWLILNPMPRVMWRWPRSHCRLVLLAMFCVLAGGNFFFFLGLGSPPPLSGGSIPWSFT